MTVILCIMTSSYPYHIMEKLISSFNTVNFQHHVPKHVLNDLDYICHCYINGITELNFGDVSSNTMTQDIEYESECDDTLFTYKDLYHVLENKLSKYVSFIDDILLHSYLEYYIEFLNT